ncbi:MAG: hypothetical protein WC120_05200 [Parcubacteria group bacterium]
MSNIERTIRRNAARSGRTVARKQAKRENVVAQVFAFLKAKRAKKARDRERAANRSGKTYAAMGINEDDLMPEQGAQR